MRTLRPACGTVSNGQLLALPEIIRIIAPGVVTPQLSSLPPASRSATEVLGSSDSRLATAQPPEPAPTTTKSNVSVTLVPPCLSFSGSAHGVSRLLGRGWAIVELLARALVFDPFWPDPAVINPQKTPPRPFPKRVSVGTYRSHLGALARGCLLRKPFGDGIDRHLSGRQFEAVSVP